MLADQSLRRAIKLCGNKQKALAKAIGEKPDKIRYWLNSAGRIPFHNAITIELATGGEVSRYDLAPYARTKNNRQNNYANIESIQSQNITISDRVSQGINFEKTLNKRQGHRTDLQLHQNFGEVEKKFYVTAASHAGFGNNETYCQAKRVLKKRIYQLIQAMDEEKISISNAAIISDLSPDEHATILQNDKKQIIELVKNLKSKKQSAINNDLDNRLAKAEKQYQLPIKLLLIGLKTYCCKQNVFPWEPDFLKSQLTPYLDIDFNQVLESMVNSGFITKVQCNHQIFGQIIFTHNHTLTQEVSS